jgi:outer membrane protein OmpA-like peptidoglycan-associated protein
VKRGDLIVFASLILAGCAHSSVVLLPSEDGGQGELAISQADGIGGETVMSQGNTRATLGSRPTVRPLGASGLTAKEAMLLASLPAPPKSFSLYFLEGTTELTAISKGRLEEVRAEVAQRPGAAIQVTGHTDTVGSDADNDALSRRRAEEILSFLESNGFPRSMMKAVGRGERELKVPTEDNVSSPVNRRVEVVVR